MITERLASCRILHFLRPLALVLLIGHANIGAAGPDKTLRGNVRGADFNNSSNEPAFAVLGAGFRSAAETRRVRTDLSDLPGGIEVTNVNPGGPAAEAGLEQGDVIIKVSGQVLTDIHKLNEAMKQAAPGDEVSLEVWNGKRIVNLTARLANARELCEIGRGWACGCLGDRYYLGDGVEKDLPKAASLYEQACELEAASGCLNLGLLSQNGEGVPTDFRRAAAFYEKACDLGLGDGCTNLGLLYTDAIGVDKDIAKAAALHERACNLGFGMGCHESGVLLEHGWGVDKDPVKAAVMYRKACDLGSAGACNNLAFLFARGVGLDKDSAKAAALYAKACGWGAAPSCFNLGELYQRGEGVAEDFSRAAELYQKACDGGDTRGCQNPLRLRQ